MDKPLELTDEMAARNDVIDNAVYECIVMLADTPVEWDMEIIGDVTDAIVAVLAGFGIKVWHPSIVTEADGSQYYSDD